jgi:hypothetical protein
MDVDGQVQELVDDTGAGQQLQRGGLDHRSPGLLVRLRLTINDPGADTVAGKLAGSEEPGGPPADNENVLHDASFLVPDAGWLTNVIQRKAWPHHKGDQEGIFEADCRNGQGPV